MESRISKSMEGDKDRISALPDYLIHQILSYLESDEEAARTCVLSKTWLQFYSTSPNLTFYQSVYPTVNEIEEQLPMFFRFLFFNSVYNTLLRYQSLNLTIHKLKIIFSCLDDVTVPPLLDKSVSLAFDIGVQELFIWPKGPHCRTLLPSSMFEHPNVLTSLTVKYCWFRQNVISNAIMFPFLKTLCLHRVRIDDEMIQKLLSRSPSLEKLVLFCVSGLMNFRVSGLGELKIIEIIMGLDTWEEDTEEFEIDIEDAPSLCYLTFSNTINMSDLSEYPFLLRVGSAPKLKVSKLQKVKIGDYHLKELVTKFPLLETLKIVECDNLQSINIASSLLKHLCLSDCWRLRKAKIDAPSLLELEYDGEHQLLLALKNHPEELVSSRSRLLCGGRVSS